MQDRGLIYSPIDHSGLDAHNERRRNTKRCGRCREVLRQRNSGRQCDKRIAPFRKVEIVDYGRRFAGRLVRGGDISAAIRKDKRLALADERFDMRSRDDRAGRRIISHGQCACRIPGNHLQEALAQWQSLDEADTATLGIGDEVHC